MRFLFLFICLITACHRAKSPLPPTEQTVATTATEDPIEPGPVKPTLPDAPVIVTEPSEEEKGLPLQLRVEALPEPHHYQVVLQWNLASARASGWTLTREDDSLSTRVVAKGGEELREWKDTTVKDGSRYRYLLWKSIDGEMELHSLAVAGIPKDLVLDSPGTKERISGIARLFLTEKARLHSTKGLIIDVDEIQSRNAVIETVGGPMMLIRAKKATGDLTLIARGADGISGAAGADGAPGRKGNKGRDADLGRILNPPGYVPNAFGVRIPVSTEAELAEVYRQVGEAHPGVHPLHGLMWRCNLHLEHGENGGRGENGQPGAPGKDGGDTAPLFVSIAEPAQFRLIHQFEPGRPGPGGAGGKGGAGGLGGQSGYGHPYGVCPPKERKEGDPGVRGIDGTPGLPGRPGKVSPHCFRIGPVENGECGEVEKIVKLNPEAST